MSQITLKSADPESITPLIISALDAEKKEITTAILKTEEKLATFEKKYNLTTADFLKKTKSLTPIPEMDLIEWSGEWETLQRLQNRLSRLEEIQICT